MKALVYQGPGLKSLEDRPKPEIQTPGDIIVRILKTTICGTDLHILKGTWRAARLAASSDTRAWASSRLSAQA